MGERLELLSSMKYPVHSISNVRRYGIPQSNAWEWANTRLGIWRIAVSWIMTRSITNEQLKAMEYDDILARCNTLRSK